MNKSQTIRYKTYEQYERSVEIEQNRKERKNIAREASAAVKSAFRDALAKVQNENTSN